MVMEMAGAPLAELRKAITQEALATQSMELVDSSSVRVNGTEGLWVRANQDYYGTTFHKQILLAADERSGFMVIATYPEARAEQEAERLRASLMTLDWTEEAVADIFEGLPFQVDIPAALQGRQRLGGTLSLSESDGTAPVPPNEALVVIGTENGVISAGDAERRVSDRARRTVTLSAFSDFEIQEIEVAGRTAYELTGSAVHEASGTPLRLYQVVIPMAFSYYIIQGMVSADREAEFMETFRSLANSFRVEAAANAQE